MGIYSEWQEKQQEIAKVNYLELIWYTKERVPIKVQDMTRIHVQNTLNWCIRKGASPGVLKDGITYQMWIAYFTARLLDPTLN